MKSEDKLRKERVGLMQAASMLGVSGSWLRHALETGAELHGRPIPEPLIRNGGTNRNQPYWELGPLMDFVAESKS